MQVSKALVELPNKPHALYRFYDRTDALLYVGITMGLPARVSQHRKAKPWWSEVQHMTVERFETRSAAVAAEVKAIKEEKPLYNSTHNELVHPPRSAHEFADVMLRHLTEHPERYAEVLHQAEQSVREAEDDPDDDLAGADPLQYAAELEADNVVTDRHLLSLALHYLMQHLPEDRVSRSMELAERERSSRSSDNDVLREAAFHIAAEYARDYLEALPERERETWRKAATNMFSVEIRPELVDFHAAGFARAFKAGEPHRYGKAQRLCHASGDDDLACPEVATINVMFKDCQLCTDDTDCKGHDLWCEEHLLRGLDGAFTWTGSGKPAVVYDYLPNQQHDPWSF